MSVITKVIYTADGSTSIFSVPFEYLSTSHAHVYINDVETTAFTWNSTYAIRMNTTPTSGTKIKIQRITPIDEPEITWTDGSVLFASDMNLQDTQLLYAEQENRNATNTAVSECETIKEETETIKNTAVSAKDTAVSAKDTAVAAKDAAVTAKNTAIIAAEGTDAQAATIGLLHSAKGWSDLSETVISYAGINVKEFGAVGDGTTDDTQAVISALAYCRTKKLTLYFPAGNFLLKESSLTAAQKSSFVQWVLYNIPCSSIKGAGTDRTKITLDGKIGFDTSLIDEIYVEDIAVVIKNCVFTENTVNARTGYVFYCNSVSKNVAVYRNILMTADVTNSSSYTTLQSGPSAIMEICTKSGLFNNIKTVDLNVGVRVYTGSKNFTISDCVFLNVDTALYINGEYFTAKDCKAVNDYNRQFIWVGKNVAVDYNGKDLILCAGNNYTLSNLYAENMPERCIYSHGSNVTANNCIAKNCGGFKFVGTDTNIIEHIRVMNCHQIYDYENETQTPNSMHFTQIYYVKDIIFDDCSCIDNNQTLMESWGNLGPFDIEKLAEDVTIKNFYLKARTKTLFGFALIATRTTADPTTAAEYYMRFKNIKVENCVFETKTITDDYNAGYSAFGHLYNIPAAGSEAAGYPQISDLTVVNCSFIDHSDSGYTNIRSKYVFGFVSKLTLINNRVNLYMRNGDSFPLIAYAPSSDLFVDDTLLLRGNVLQSESSVQSNINSLSLTAGSKIVLIGNRDAQNWFECTAIKSDAAHGITFEYNLYFKNAYEGINIESTDFSAEVTEEGYQKTLIHWDGTTKTTVYGNVPNNHVALGVENSQTRFVWRGDISTAKGYVKIIIR